MNGLRPINGYGIPILGRAPNEDAIKLLKGALARLENGELINAAIVGEQSDGEMFYGAAAGYGHPIKLRGTLGVLQTVIDLGLLGK